MPDYKISEYAQVLPDMSAKEYQALLDDIKEHGLRDDIVLHNGEILDGRHRYRACLEAGVEPSFTEYPGGDPACYVISVNLKRRNLKEGQIGMLVNDMISLKKKLEKEARENQNKGQDRGRETQAKQREAAKSGLASVDAKPPNKGESHNNKTATKMAKSAGISSATVERSGYVKEHGTPEDVAEVKRGDVSVSAKVEEIKRRKASQHATGNGTTDSDADKAVTRLLQWAAEQGPVTAEEAAAHLKVLTPVNAGRYLRTLVYSRDYDVRRAGEDKTYLVTKVLKILAVNSADDTGGDAPVGFVPISPTAARCFYRENIQEHMKKLLEFKHCDRATFRPGQVYSYAEIIDRKIKELFKLISGVEVGG